GALGLDKTVLAGKVLLNLDTEDEGVVCVGCAGGEEAMAFVPVERKQVDDTCKFVKISLKGLRGGHSGLDIDLGRANALKLLGELLKMAEEKYSLYISSIKGGTVSNAIPREAFCLCALPESEINSFAEYCVDFGQDRKRSYL